MGSVSHHYPISHLLYFYSKLFHLWKNLLNLFKSTNGKVFLLWLLVVSQFSCFLPVMLLDFRLNAARSQINTLKLPLPSSWKNEKLINVIIKKPTFMNEIKLVRYFGQLYTIEEYFSYVNNAYRLYLKPLNPYIPNVFNFTSSDLVVF